MTYEAVRVELAIRGCTIDASARDVAVELASQVRNPSHGESAGEMKITGQSLPRMDCRNLSRSVKIV